MCIYYIITNGWLPIDRDYHPGVGYRIRGGTSHVEGGLRDVMDMQDPPCDTTIREFFDRVRALNFLYDCQELTSSLVLSIESCRPHAR